MTPGGYDSSFIADALPAFISEANEQIEALEQLLLQLEDAPADRQLLDALFRCAHTVKGSAGIFGLDDVVAFTHHVETLLDQVRAGAVALTPALSTLLLQCNDEIRALVGAAEDPQAGNSPGGADSAERAERAERTLARAALVAQLQRAAGGDAAATASANAANAANATTATPLANARRAADAAAPVRSWHVSVQFGADTFRNGMDPLAVLNYVSGLGDVPQIVCDTAAVPALDAIDPESCHLAFQFGLQTAALREQIDAAFSFVRDDCTLHIIEPGAGPDDFARLIDAMPDSPRLGDILVAVGAITTAQLQQALHRQTQTAALQGATAPPLGQILQTISGVDADVVDAALAKQKQQRSRSPAGADDNRFIRVQADRLDAVIDLLGELVIAGAGAALLARQTRQGTLIEANAQIGRLIEEIRNGTLQLRMVPVGDTFSRFRRVARDTAAELGKDVAFEVLGGETELDKAVVERIADPLMHVVRNALDHALETPAQRVAAGKPAQGKLTLAACHESGSILIRISDDGRGIDPERVLKRAVERGLVAADVRPSDDDILKLIFAPGFSTAEKVTKLSGRGVGLDVVKSNIEALRGSVAVHTNVGVGSCIEIRLPLTLAIIDGFLVGVGTSRFIFPLQCVVEVIETRSNAAAFDSAGRGVVSLRGHALPVVSLRALYGLPAAEPLRASIVVIQGRADRYGVLVDQLLGQHQAVIKPLARMFRSLQGITGSSILGNGDVALIFDADALAGLATRPPQPTSFNPTTAWQAETARAATASLQGRTT